MNNVTSGPNRVRGTIARIKIFIHTPSNIRLRLLHHRARQLSVSVQEGKKQLKLLSSDEIPEELTWQDFELGRFEEGRHELELVVKDGRYSLRGIQIGFWTQQPSVT